jgi:hypothetical protein
MSQHHQLHSSLDVLMLPVPIFYREQLPVPLVPIIGKGVLEEEVMVSFVTTNGEPTTTTTSKLVWWNLVDQMTMTLTSCTSAAMLPTRTRASPSRALYKSGSIIVLGKTNFLRPGMVRFLPPSSYLYCLSFLIHPSA